MIYLRDELDNWSFHAKKAWIYGLFRVKTTLNQRFLNYGQPISEIAALLRGVAY